MSYKIKNYFLIFIIIYLTSCGSETSTTPDAGFANSWGYSCATLVNASGVTQKPTTLAFTLTDSTFNGSLIRFTAGDGVCDSSITTSFESKIDFTGTVTRGSLDQTPIEIDFTYSTASMTYFTDQDVSYANGDEPGVDATCGGGWVKGTAKPLTATDCANANTLNLPYKDLQVLQIYNISANTLTFGGDEGGQHFLHFNAARPTSLASLSNIDVL